MGMLTPTLRPLLGPLLLALSGLGLRMAASRGGELLGLPSEDELTVGLRELGAVIVWGAVAWGGARIIELSLQRAAKVTRGGVPYPRLLRDLLRGLLFIAVGFAVLSFVFEQSAFGLVTTSGVAIAVIGLALRSLLSDVFAGLALSFDHPYNIGDWIQTSDGVAGRVVEISWRTTRIITREGIAHMVPNGQIASNRLVNYGPAGTRYRAVLRVPLDATVPPERARRVLLGGAIDAGRRIGQLNPDVLLLEMADGTATYGVRFQVPDYSKEVPTRDVIARSVLRAVQYAGLSISRPVRDITVARHVEPARPRRSALLQRIPLFRVFPLEERLRLEEQMQERLLQAGDTVVHQGEEGNSLFVVCEGALEVAIQRDGRRQVVNRLVAGEVFGEMSALTGQPRSATVMAETDSVVFEISHLHLQEVLLRRPDLAESLAGLMERRLTQNEASEIDAVLAAPRGPVAKDSVLHKLRAFFNLGG